MSADIDDMPEDVDDISIDDMSVVATGIAVAADGTTSGAAVNPATIKIASIVLSKRRRFIAFEHHIPRFRWEAWRIHNFANDTAADGHNNASAAPCRALKPPADVLMVPPCPRLGTDRGECRGYGFENIAVLKT
jgi:hypothetical protein